MDNFPLDHRQIQLDSEEIQKLMLSQLVQTSAASSAATSQEETNIARSKSPLSQAMLQIHSPSSVPELNVGETVVLQMEDGKATLQMEEGKATLITHHSNGISIKSEKKDNNNGESKSSNESDEVFEKRREKAKSEIHTKQTLQAVLSNLITAHAGNMNKEQEIQANMKGEDVNKNAKKGPQDVNSPKSTFPTILVSPTMGSSSILTRGTNSPGSRKGSVSDGSMSGSSNGSPTSLTSPGAIQVSAERKRSKVKAPHPAFNIQGTPAEKRGLLYNYNLPDRGLGTMPSPTVSVSPPAVNVPRFPVSVPTAMASQVLSFVTAGGAWPMQRPLNHSPNSNDSRNSGSPLDLSSVRDSSPSLAKSKAELKVPTAAPVSILPKQQAVKENGQSSPLTSPKLVNDVAANGKKQQMAKKQQPEATSPSAAKPPYTQEMLYLFNKELEIVSVGNNKWIVRNENDLVNLIKKNNEEANYTNGDAKSPTGKRNSPNGDLNKRSSSVSECNEDEQRSKVMKLTNGDVHVADKGHLNVSLLTSKVSSAVSDTNSTVGNGKTDVEMKTSS